MSSISSQKVRKYGMQKKICENLKALRNINRLSQKDLAKMLNVSFKTISHWESGYSEPNIDLIIQIKKIFNISYEDLLE